MARNARRGWAAGVPMRGQDDRADLEAFLSRHPGTVNGHYEWDCGTPLHAAATHGRDDLVPVLIARGADLNARDFRGDTPLQIAATFARAKIVTMLLAAGANANGSGLAGRLPLHSAVAGAPGAPDVQAQLAVVRLLLAAGADINAREPSSERTALIYAIGSGPRTDNNDEMGEFLVQRGADVHARDSQGTAALAYAAGTGNGRTVTLLLQRGAD